MEVIEHSERESRLVHVNFTRTGLLFMDVARQPATLTHNKLAQTGSSYIIYILLGLYKTTSFTVSLYLCSHTATWRDFISTQQIINLEYFILPKTISNRLKGTNMCVLYNVCDKTLEGHYKLSK